MHGPVWVDSHCHLEALDDPSGAVERAGAAGVTAMVTVGTDLETSRRCVEIAGIHSRVWAAVGVHPHNADSLTDAGLAELLRLAEDDRVVAIGEIGLDYDRDLSPRPIQRESFRRQLAAAKNAGRAVVIHMREALEDLLVILEDEGPPERLVFHCFSGGPADAERAASLGGYISFAGNVSFKNAGALREAAQVVPLDRLLVETDSPYLAPVPHRGKPNEPRLVAIVGAAVAEATGRPGQEIAAATTRNASRVFAIPLGA
ncbi:MAG: TatD family hydrolase [Actinomycetota bacterium]